MNPTIEYNQKLVHATIDKLIREHFMIEELRTLVTSFIQFKQNETTVWWRLPLYIHYIMGGESNEIHYAAAQAELLILSLDIIDDLQDQDNFAPPWMHCDRFIASNVASALLVIGITNKGHSSLTTSIIHQLMLAHNGQYFDHLSLTRTNSDYFDLIKQKSSALIAIVLLMGYQLTNNSTEEGKNAIIELAHYIGIGAQLQNDLKDIQRLNKRSDIVQRKRTHATMYLLERSKEHFPILLQYYDKQCSIDELLTLQSDFSRFVQASGVKHYIHSIQHENSVAANHLLDKIALNLEYIEKFKILAIYPFLNKV